MIQWQLLITLALIATILTITILVNARILYFYNKSIDPMKALTTILNTKDNTQNIEELFNARG